MRGNPVRTLDLIKEVKKLMAAERVNRAAALRMVAAKYGMSYTAVLGRFNKAGVDKQNRNTAKQYRQLNARTVKKIKDQFDSKNIITSFVLYT